MKKTNYMKKVNKIMIVLMLMFIFSFSSNVKAHSVELDPDSLISFPLMVLNGEGKITIANSETNYTLSYQAVEIPENQASQIEQTISDGKKVLEEIKTELDTLNSECDELEVIYNDAKEKLDSLIEQGVEGTELEEAEQACDEAEANFTSKIEEVKAKTTEYNNKSTELNAKVNELTPMYNDANWIITEDGSFKIDTSSFSGKKTYVLWAKLVKEDQTIVYDEMIYTTEGSKEEGLITSIKLDKSEISLTKGSSYSFKITITPANVDDKTLVWTSDNEKVATVDNGIVKAVSTGTATITVSTKDGKVKDTCKVKVTDDIVIDDSDDNDDENIEGSIYDDSIAEGKIPQTGSKYIFALSISILVIVSIFLYRKFRKNDFK